MPTLQPTSQGKLALRVVEKVDKSSTSHNIARHVIFQVAGKIASCNSTLIHALDQFYVVQPFRSVYNTQMNATEQYFPAAKCVFHTQRDNFFIHAVNLHVHYPSVFLYYIFIVNTPYVVYSPTTLRNCIY